MSQTIEQVQVQSASHMRNAARVKRDEEELAKLIAEHTGQESQDETESYSEDFEDTKVQTQGDTQQEEAYAKDEAQEEEPLSKEEESFKKRYSDIRRHMQDKEQEWKLRFEQLQSQLDKATKNELVLPKSDKEIEAWAKKYPDVAGIVEAIADRKAQERSSDIDKRLSEIEQLRVQARQQKAEAELLHMHPDFESIRSDDAFHDWADEQPKWVQDALYDNVDDAKAVARVIDLYKSDKGITKSSNKREDKSAASSVKSRSRGAPNADANGKLFSESKVNKMSDKEYEANVDAIMEAMRTDNFIYDVTRR